jgi:hypothetical protein
VVSAAEFLGDVCSEAVCFDGRGWSKPVTFTVSLVNPGTVKLDHVVWQWEFKRGEAHGDDWTPANQSEHDVAVTLGLPDLPWSIDGPRCGTVPWWEVLRRAAAFAAGSGTPDEATSLIGEGAYRVWGQTYYRWAPTANAFASDPTTEPDDGIFDCAKFLRLLDGKMPPQTVDCTDIAAIVASFAAILGSPVGELAIHEGLECNPIRLVGEPNWRLGRAFGLHEIVVRSYPGKDVKVWDACLEASGDREIQPNRPPVRALLPLHRTDEDYVKRLLRDARKTLADHYHSGPRRRVIETLRAYERPATVDKDPYLAQIAQQYGQKEWPVGEKPLRPVMQFDIRSRAVKNWVLISEPVSAASSDPQAALRVSRGTWHAERDSVALIRAEAYVAPDVRTARDRLVAVLARFGAAQFDRAFVNVWSGSEVLFTSSDGLALATSRANAVLVARAASSGVTATDVRTFLAQIDEFLLAAALPA